jgi:hypothetical protein
MADDTVKRLEARITELESKLGQAGQPVDVSAEDMATFHKVSEALGGGVAAGCVVCAPSCISECRPCVVKCIKPCIITHCYKCICTPCINECICGPCIHGGGGTFGGGGFGGFGG